jgi:hypothetical protein
LPSIYPSTNNSRHPERRTLCCDFPSRFSRIHHQQNLDKPTGKQKNLEVLRFWWLQVEQALAVERKAENTAARRILCHSATMKLVRTSKYVFKHLTKLTAKKY